jgi:hypothetical protein
MANRRITDLGAADGTDLVATSLMHLVNTLRALQVDQNRRVTLEQLDGFVRASGTRLVIPSGISAARPSPALDGDLFYNEAGYVEYYFDGSWFRVGAGQFLPLAGGTLTGPLEVRSSDDSAAILASRSGGLSNLGLRINGVLDDLPSAGVTGFIGTANSSVAGPSTLAGDLLIAPRTNVNASVRVFTGDPVTERLRVSNSGVNMTGVLTLDDLGSGATPHATTTSTNSAYLDHNFNMRAKSGAVSNATWNVITHAGTQVLEVPFGSATSDIIMREELRVPGISFDSGSNYLSNYTQGTWTPSWSFSASGSVTYGARVGYYTRVGNIVTIQCHISTATTSSPSGNANITGLPFNSANNTNRLIGVTIGVMNDWGTSMPDIKGYLSDNSAFLWFLKNATNGGFTSLTGADFKSGSGNTLVFGLVYHV